MPRCNWCATARSSPASSSSSKAIGGVDSSAKSGEYSLKKVGLPHEIHHFSPGRTVPANTTQGFAGHATHSQEGRRTRPRSSKRIATSIRIARSTSSQERRHRHRPLCACKRSRAMRRSRDSAQRAVSRRSTLRAALRQRARKSSRSIRATIAWCSAWAPAKFGTIDRYYGTAPDWSASRFRSNHAGRTQLYMRWCRSSTRRAMLREGTATAAIRDELALVRRRRKWCRGCAELTRRLPR